jgi:hypothetical protein
MRFEERLFEMGTTWNVLKRISASIALAGVLCAGSVAAAALNLAPPQDLLKKASQDRRQLREVLLDMQQNIPEMRDPKTFDSYFFLLADMQKLADKLQLEAIFPKAVEATGLKMVSHGIRWLDVSQRSLSDALYYQSYADADVMSRFLAELELQVRNIRNNQARLKAVAVNLEGMLPAAEKKFEERRDVRISMRQILSSIAIKFLKTEQLNDQESAFWIGKISLPTAYSEYIEALNESVLDTFPKDAAALSLISKRLRELGKKISAETYPLPTYVASAWGDTAVELVLRTIQGERKFEAGEFENLVELLRSRQLQGLAGQWLSAERLPTTTYSAHYLQISNVLIARLRSVGLSKEAADVALHISRMAAPIQASKSQLEGLYALKSSDGSKFNFVIIRARPNLVYASLEDDKGYVTLGFFNVTFDSEKGKFVASQREPDLDATANPTVSFSINTAGEIELEAPIASTGWRKMKGKRTSTFTNFLDDESQTFNSTEGEWEGEMTFVGQSPWKVRLVISKIGLYSVGRLTMGTGVAIDFHTGTPGDKGVVYLTTGRLSHTGWVHLRAVRRGDYLEGLTITSSGVSVPYFKLKKVK